MTVRPADRLRIRAADWNAMTRAARQIDAMPLAVGAPGPGLLATSPTTALARNTDEELIPQFGVVVCTGPVIPPSDAEAEWARRLAVDCKIPDTDDPLAWIAIAATPISPGKFGRIVVAGAVQAIVNVTSTGHKFAVIESGEPYLQSASSGPMRLLWSESGTGEKRAFVALGASAAPPGLRFKISGASAIAGRQFQWDYPGSEATLDVDGLPVLVPGGISATLRNLAEVMNSATYAGGIDPTYLPSGIEIQPIGRKKTGPFVGALVDAVLLEDGRWWFDRLNAPDGPCG